METALDWITGIGQSIAGLTAPIVDWFNTKNTNDTNTKNVNNTNETNLQMTRETNELNKQIADQNYAQQERLFEYNKALQEKMFEREDTSYQRTKEDMLAAGLNPLTMQGTNSAGEAIAQAAPQNQMQYQKTEFQAPQIQKSTAANTMLQAANELFTNMQDLQTGQITRDKLRQEKKYAEYDHIINGLKHGFYWDSEKNEWSFDDEQFDKYLNKLHSETEADFLEAEDRKRQIKHKIENNIYDTDTKVERALTALTDWLTSGRSEAMWNKLVEKYPMLNLLQEYANQLMETTTNSNGERLTAKEIAIKSSLDNSPKLKAYYKKFHKETYKKLYPEEFKTGTTTNSTGSSHSSGKF